MLKHLPLTLAIGAVATLPAAAQVVPGVQLPKAQVNVGTGAGAKVMTPPANANANANAHVHANTQTHPRVELPNPAVEGRVNSRGKANASMRGLANSSGNSALADPGIDLSAVTAGSAVVNADGAAIGSVSDLVVNKDSGGVVGLEVTLDNGDVIEIPASQLDISGDVITTTYIVAD